MGGLLERLGRGCARHHRAVIGAWLVAVVGVIVLNVVAAGDYSNSFALPGTEAQRAADVLADKFPEQNGARAQIAFRAKSGTIADQASQVQAALEEAGKLPHIVTNDDGDPIGVSNLFVPDTSCTITAENPFCTVSEDGEIAYANLAYTKSTTDLGLDAADELEDKVGKFRTEDLEIQLGGDLVVNTEPIDTGASEEIGIVAAIIVLLITLGAVASMGVPILAAIVGVGSGVAVIGLLANVLTIPSVAPSAAIMVGLGVGIDYSLFVVSRFKTALEDGSDPVAAAGETVATSGRAVVTAGSTVIVALLGLVVFQVPAVSVIALAIAVVVVVSIIAAVTLLPAVLGLLGHHVEWGRIRFVHPHDRAGGRRWIRFVTRVPIASVVVGVLALLVIASASLGLRLGPSDATDSPKGSTERRTYNLIAEGFGPGYNNPFLAVVEVKGGSTAADSQVITDFENLLTAIEGEKDVAAVSPSPESLASTQVVDGVFNSPQQNTAIFSVVADSEAKSERTPELVDHLRDRVIPDNTKGTDLDVLVGGTSASYVDLDQRIASRLTLFIGIVIAISFVILGTVFRSVLIPLTAAVFNLLVIFAAYGVLVAVFQWGWLLSVIGVDHVTPIISYLAPLVFAVLFGLSMDYEVYIVSRAKEEYDSDGDPVRAVTEGIGTAVRLVVAAATIMFFVFIAFVLSPSIIMKMFGMGLAFAILIDAFIVRMVVLPATLRLLGRAAWWPGVRHARSKATPSPTTAAGTPERPAPEPAG